MGERVNKLTSLAQWLASKLGRPANQILIETDERSEYVLPSPVPVILAGNMNSGGSFTGNSATGTVPVTEASAAGISTIVGIINSGVQATLPTIASSVGSAVVLDSQKRRIGRAVITCDGAGAYANQSLVAALAGYYGVCRMKSIKANAAVGAGAILTFESPAGTAALPSIEVMPALTQNVRSDTALPGVVITHATLVDAQAIVVDLSGFGAGTIVELEFEYHYET